MRRLGAVLPIFSLDMLLFGQTLRMPLGLPRWLWTASLTYRLAPHRVCTSLLRVLGALLPARSGSPSPGPDPGLVEGLTLALP